MVSQALGFCVLQPMLSRASFKNLLMSLCIQRVNVQKTMSIQSSKHVCAWMCLDAFMSMNVCTRSRSCYLGAQWLTCTRKLLCYAETCMTFADSWCMDSGSNSTFENALHKEFRLACLSCSSD